MPCSDDTPGISESIVIINMQTSSVSCIACRGGSRGRVHGVRLGRTVVCRQGIINFLLVKKSFGLVHWASCNLRLI